MCSRHSADNATSFVVVVDDDHFEIEGDGVLFFLECGKRFPGDAALFAAHCSTESDGMAFLAGWNRCYSGDGPWADDDHFQVGGDSSWAVLQLDRWIRCFDGASSVDVRSCCCCCETGGDPVALLELVVVDCRGNNHRCVCLPLHGDATFAHVRCCETDAGEGEGDPVAACLEITLVDCVSTFVDPFVHNCC